MVATDNTILAFHSPAPEVIEHMPIDLEEMMFHLYMPVKFPGSDVRLPHHLRLLKTLVQSAIRRERLENDTIGPAGKFIYLTVKNLYTPAGIAPNRPGWHSDGFGTNDINYIYYSNSPTEFCVQDYVVSADDQQSLQDFEEQSNPENIVTFPADHLLRLTPNCIHRVAENADGGMRLFVKISISPDKYKKKGNAVNHLFSYGWNYIDRAEQRNQP